MVSPFYRLEVNDPLTAKAMLDARWREWSRRRRNLLARRQYRIKVRTDKAQTLDSAC